MPQAEVTWVFNIPGSSVEYSEPGPTLQEAARDYYELGYNPTLVRKMWPRVVWPGLYPLYYRTVDGGCFCPKCANENIELTLGDDPQWKIEEVDANMESTTLFCNNCYEFIPNSNGDVEPDVPTEDGDDNE